MESSTAEVYQVPLEMWVDQWDIIYHVTRSLSLTQILLEYVYPL
jgi:hypothetical protein